MTTEKGGQIAVHRENGNRKVGGQLVTTIPGSSTRTSCSAWPSSREPFLKRGLAFPRWFAGEEAFDADVLVELDPVNAVPSANQSPALAFR